MKRSHPRSLALVLFAGAFAVLSLNCAQGRGSGEQDDGITYQTCTYEGKTYGNHAILCMEGILYRCDGAGTSGIWRTVPDGECAPGTEVKNCLYEGSRFGEGAVKKMEAIVYECTKDGIWSRQGSP